MKNVAAESNELMNPERNRKLLECGRSMQQLQRVGTHEEEMKADKRQRPLAFPWLPPHQAQSSLRSSRREFFLFVDTNVH